MRKISYRPVYNRKKCLNSRGTALVQVEAYLNKKKVYFSTHIYLRPEQWDVKNILVLRNAFEKTRKQMKVNVLSINALSDNLNFQMFAKLTLKKT